MNPRSFDKLTLLATALRAFELPHLLAPAADAHARYAQSNWIGLDGAATAWLAISFVVWFSLDPWRGRKTQPRGS